MLAHALFQHTVLCTTIDIRYIIQRMRFGGNKGVRMVYFWLIFLVWSIANFCPILKGIEICLKSHENVAPSLCKIQS